MSKNPTLRRLFMAIEKGDRGAVLPLADHLEELNAPDLAALIRDGFPQGGGPLVEAIARAFDGCHAGAGHDLLRWEDDPFHRPTLALHRAVLALPLDDVPVLTDALDLDDRRAWVRQARALFRQLRLRGIEVDPRKYGGSVSERGGFVPPICVYVPTLQEMDLDEGYLRRELREEEIRAWKRVIAKLGNILARAFPSLGASCVPERPDEPCVRGSIGCSRRSFMFVGNTRCRWRIPWERWSPPELALWRPPEAAGGGRSRPVAATGTLGARVKDWPRRRDGPYAHPAGPRNKRDGARVGAGRRPGNRGGHGP
jgi:hypothetical protein